ncbi:MAG: sulfite exporter TauE/SafE family protein [Fimbriimonadales bacterium]
MPVETLYLIALTFGVALLYSSVGHGGASGYLAAMGLLGMAPAQMKPTALVLNLLVAGVGTLRYVRSDCFSWRAFWPFALGSIPLAFIGGSQQLTPHVYQRMLGVVLILAAAGMVFRIQRQEQVRALFLPIGLAIGVAIGYVSGLIGIGGGIFLSPILILTRWATTKQTLGIASLFILVNSFAGLVGQIATLQNVPREAAYIAPAALAGGLLGSWLGARRLATPALRILLAAVLVTASIKLLK